MSNDLLLGSFLTNLSSSTTSGSAAGAVDTRLIPYAVPPRTAKGVVEVFYGTFEENVNQWIDRFDKFVRINDYSNCDILPWFHTCFGGSAKRWYDSLDSYTTARYERVLDEMKKVFSNGVKNRYFEQRLATRQLGPNEDVSAYAVEISHLCKRIDPRMKDAEKIRHFKRGLPEKMIVKIDEENPSKFSDAIKIAQRVQAASANFVSQPGSTNFGFSNAIINNITGTTNSVAPTTAPTQLVSTVASLDKESAILAQLKKMETRLYHIEKRQREIIEKNREFKRPKLTATVVPQRECSNRNGGKQPLACWTCNGPHKARDCPRRNNSSPTEYKVIRANHGGGKERKVNAVEADREQRVSD